MTEHPAERLVYVIDDDRDVRMSLTFQLRTLGYQPHPFLSAIDFLDALSTLAPGCILLDVRMPEMDGVQALVQFAQRGKGWPVVVMTGHAEVSIAVEVMKGGAIDFLEKPFEEALLRSALERGFEKLHREEARSAQQKEAEQRLSRLSPRESEVLHAMLAGTANKNIAHQLDLSIRTVEMHRASVLAKLGVRTVAEAAVLASRSVP